METVHILLLNQVDWSFTENVLISVKFADIRNIYMYLICGNEIVKKKKNPKFNFCCCKQFPIVTELSFFSYFKESGKFLLDINI